MSSSSNPNWTNAREIERERGVLMACSFPHYCSWISSVWLEFMLLTFCFDEASFIWVITHLCCLSRYWMEKGWVYEAPLQAEGGGVQGLSWSRYVLVCDSMDGLHKQITLTYPVENLWDDSILAINGRCRPSVEKSSSLFVWKSRTISTVPYTRLDKMIQHDWLIVCMDICIFPT